MSLLVFRRYELKKNVFLLFNLYLLFEQEEQEQLCFQPSFIFCDFYPESLKVNVNTETGTFNPQYWNFGTSRHALLSLEALIHLNMFYIDSYVPFLPCGLFISSKVQKCQQKC